MTTKIREIEGYRLHSMLGKGHVFPAGKCEDAYFSTWEGQPCVEALVWFGLAKSPYLLHLTIEEALTAGVIQEA
jgi:hypothetical protein